MSLKSAAAGAIVSTIVLSQMILLSGARPGAASGNPSPSMTFDCDPANLQGARKLMCLTKRFEEGRRLFDEETFGGNGRTCVTCHSVKNGTFSPEDALQRLLENPNDPLFVGDGLDDGVQGTSRITEHATVRIEIPLPPRVKLLNDPTATSVIFLRGTPTTRTAPYFHDNSSKTLEEVAEHYTFFFQTEAGISLTPQDEADIVAFLRLL